MTARLTSTEGLPETVTRPGYDRSRHGAGIVHLGLGAFHKAHQAVYTDDALAAAGGDWRIIGISPRRHEAATQLLPQNKLYTVIERDRDGSHARVIGALADALTLSTDRTAVIDALTAPTTRIVSLTVTEKGYGIDPLDGTADPAHPAIAADLLRPETPQGVAGLLVLALRRRKAVGTPPFAVLCCDNLPENGAKVRRLLTDFAELTAPDIADFIATDVPFPCTMVDRITPASTPETLTLAEQLVGRRDEAVVEAETFRQWVIEDVFPGGRPAWEAGGAIVTSDVAPYETMKLRMLNGAHSMLAYTGFLSGHRTVRDVMGDGALVTLIERHLCAAAATLQPVSGVDFGQYADDLLDRFANPNLAHETYQIAMDGSQKMPQRIFAPAVHALAQRQPIDAFAFATAGWLRYTAGRTDDGRTYTLRDPLIADLDAAGMTAEALIERVHGLPGLVPHELRNSTLWRGAVTTRLQAMLDHGVRAAIDNEGASLGAAV